MREKVQFLALLILIVGGIAIGVSYYVTNVAQAPLQGPAGQEGPVEVVFVIEPGQSTAEIAENLAKEQLIPSAFAFQWYARFRGMDGRLEAGRYTLRSDMTMAQILETLTSAPGPVEIEITIPEGMRLEQVAELLEEKGIFAAADFRAALQEPYDYDFLTDRPEGASLEGYLFPDTYRIFNTDPPTRLVTLMLENFGTRFDTAMRRQAQEKGMTIFEVVTLASIVEKEAILDEERPLIASVYLNRLEAGMTLDADPTVQYAIGYNARQGRWWPELYFDELKIDRLSDIDSPYNTYRYAGLPPGPICSPGLAAIQAVLWPADTDYYYFVAKGDGSHAFARTLEEHNANVAKYQR